MQKSLLGSLAITKLKHAITKMKGKNGEVKGIFIPIDANYLVTGKDGAYYLPIRVIVRDQDDQYGQCGFVSQSVDSKVYKEASPELKETFKSLPILGNLKDFSNYHNDNDGALDDFTGQAPMSDLPEDDLPF